MEIKRTPKRLPDVAFFIFAAATGVGFVVLLYFMLRSLN